MASFISTVRHWKYLGLALVVGLTLISHVVNLAGYPYFENDEGTYTSQAWWTVKYGKLSPYTYTYDHFPFGWAQIGLWQILTGGPFAFGFSLFSTRVFMVIVAIVANSLVYLTVREITRNNKAALAAAIFLAISPLSVYFHRRVLLDNLSNLWLTASIYLLVRGKSRLGHITASAVAFGLAVWSKELALIFAPMMILAVYLTSHKTNRSFATVAFLTTVGFFTLAIPGLAILKGEFLPAGWLGDDRERVSMVTTWVHNLSRGAKYPFWDARSEVARSVASWWFLDPLMVVMSGWLLTVNLFGKRRHRWGIVAGILGLSFILFCLKGGLVLNFYIVPMVSILAIALGVVIQDVWEMKEGRFRGALRVVTIASIPVLLIYYGWQGRFLYFRNETKNQLGAVKYVKQNVAAGAGIVIDDFALTDMKHETRDGPAFVNAEWFSKIERDPEIRMGKFRGKWENIDYVMLSHEMVALMGQGELPFVKEIYEHSDVVRDFPSTLGTYRDLALLVSTNGDWITLFRVKAVPGRKDFRSKFGELLSEDEEVSLAKVKEKLDRMSQDEKIGQLVWMGFGEAVLSEETGQYIAEKSIGGVVLSASSILSKDQLTTMTTDLQAAASRGPAKVPIFVAVDQEGGSVARIPFEPTASTSQADVKTYDRAKEIGEARGAFLKEVGINVNLAPVVDIYGLLDSFVGRRQRSFGEDPTNIALLASAMIDGYEKNKIISVVKHFPGGLGFVSSDPHVNHVVVSKGEEIYEKGVAVYRQITGRVAGIMVDNLEYLGIDREVASLSKEIIEVRLREKLGFGGLVVTDDLNMKSVNEPDLGQASKKAILAGVDVVMVIGGKGDVDVAIRGIKEAIESGEISLERLDESVERVLLMKGRYVGF